jgi:hypothetical protein
MKEGEWNGGVVIGKRGGKEKGPMMQRMASMEGNGMAVDDRG